MELQKFISESIKQICLGIKDGKEEVAGKIGNCPVSPGFIDGKQIYGKAEEICFDVAITVTEDNKLNAAGKVNIKIADGSLEKHSSEKIENISRISFKIPFYPQLLNGKEQQNLK